MLTSFCHFSCLKAQHTQSLPAWKWDRLYSNSFIFARPATLCLVLCHEFTDDVSSLLLFIANEWILWQDKKPRGCCSVVKAWYIFYSEPLSTIVVQKLLKRHQWATLSLWRPCSIITVMGAVIYLELISSCIILLLQYLTRATILNWKTSSSNALFTSNWLSATSYSYREGFGLVATDRVG